MDQAYKLYRLMNGVFPIYKPPNKSMRSVTDFISINLARALNALQCRPIRNRLLLSNESNGTSLISVPDLSDHPLVVGPRYNTDHFKIVPIDALTSFASGVTVLALNGGRQFISDVYNAKLMRVYHIKAMLGRATLDHKVTGKVMQTSNYSHVTSTRMERVLSAVQAGHHRSMLIASGVDPQSQEAYDLAVKGAMRPSAEHKGPVLYAIRCIEFKPPSFTLEVHSINETNQYILNLVHNIGLELKSTAYCTQLRRIRYGMYTLEDSIVPLQTNDPHDVINCLNASRVNFSQFKHNPLFAYLQDDDDGVGGEEEDVGSVGGRGEEGVVGGNGRV